MSWVVRSCQELSGARSCQELSGAVMSCQELSGAVRSCQELSGVVRSCESCQELSGVVRSCQELSGVVRSYQELGVVRSCQELSWAVRSCQELSGVVSCQELSGVIRSCQGSYQELSGELSGSSGVVSFRSCQELSGGVRVVRSCQELSGVSRTSICSESSGLSGVVSHVSLLYPSWWRSLHFFPPQSRVQKVRDLIILQQCVAALTGKAQDWPWNVDSLIIDYAALMIISYNTMTNSGMLYQYNWNAIQSPHLTRITQQWLTHHWKQVFGIR